MRVFSLIAAICFLVSGCCVAHFTKNPKAKEQKLFNKEIDYTRKRPSRIRTFSDAQKSKKQEDPPPQSP